ncbi:MAG: imidazole glycerol phosphate synthase subunit HisH [bacterium]
MIAVIDYGMGNLRSVAKAIERIGGTAVVTSKNKDILKSKKIILPGVGAFKAGMSSLRRLGLVEVIKQQIAAGVPCLGICLGYQLLFEMSSEDGKNKGLGIIKGDVKPLQSKGKCIRIPHMGWNTIEIIKRGFLFKGIPNKVHLYFVHSYYCDPTDDALITSWVKYGLQFAASIQKDNVFGIQFHPEKSSSKGMEILKNFVSINY